MTTRVPTPSHLTTADVDRYLGAMRQVWEQNPDSAVRLDWAGELHGIEGAAGQVLANGLLATLGDVRLIVHVPDVDDYRRTNLARSGVLFALAHRDEERTELIGEQVEKTDLQPWRMSWSPSASSAFELVAGDQAQLFGPGVAGESVYAPSLHEAHYAAFVNPHLSDPGHGHTSLRDATHPWLRRLLGVGGRWAGDELERFLQACGTVVDELVDNVREHARRDDHGYPSESLVTIGVTRGTPRRLHVGVMDTGPGIATTARPKVGAPSRATDEQLIEGLLLGTYQGWHHGRGIGLPNVWDICDRYGGGVFVASNASRVVVRNGRPVGSRSSVRLGGTVVEATIRVPPKAA